MLVGIRSKQENISGFQPLFKEVFHERGSRARICEHAPHLLIKDVGITQFSRDR